MRGMNTLFRSCFAPASQLTVIIGSKQNQKGDSVTEECAFIVGQHSVNGTRRNDYPRMTHAQTDSVPHLPVASVSGELIGT